MITNVLVEYIWLDAKNNFRSKIRVCSSNNITDDITDWNYDGSSTGQADIDSSEIILKPCKIFNNPLLNNKSKLCKNNKLVVCSTYNIKGEPLSNNHRHEAEKIFNSKLEEEPWFGLEQEYYMFDKKVQAINCDKLGQYYCNPIVQEKICTQIAEEHAIACLEAGIKISGINAEVAPRQWEFQIGPCVGINAGDDMMAARYLLERIAAIYELDINFHPKPIGTLSGSGMHTNFSTCKMRNDGGIKEIIRVIENLKKSHETDILKYGLDNNLRLTGSHETANIKDFSYGIGSRNTSIRIGYETAKNNKGYFEDRRPAANCDPYLVTSSIFSSV